MSKYTVEQVEELAADILRAYAASITGMRIALKARKGFAVYEALRGYADLLREREQNGAWEIEQKWTRYWEEHFELLRAAGAVRRKQP